MVSFKILNIVYIVERNVHPYGSLIRMGRVKVRRKVGGTNVSIFSLLWAQQEARLTGEKMGHSLL